MIARRVDRKKILQILSVYVLALIAAVICGNAHNGKSFAQHTPPEQATRP